MSGPNTSRMRSENGFEHKGGLCVTGVSVHEATNSGPSGDAIEVADRALQAGDHRQCREPGGLLRRFERDLARYLAEGASRCAVGERSVAGHEGALSSNADPFE